MIDRSSIITPLDQSTTLKLLAVHRTAIDHSQIGLVKGRLVYYEKNYFANKHIYCIVILFSLRHKKNILCMSHLFLGIWVSIEYYTTFAFVSFGLECVPILQNESHNVFTVYLNIDGDDVVKS